MSKMMIIKRDGSKQPMMFDKITERIENLIKSSYEYEKCVIIEPLGYDNDRDCDEEYKESLSDKDFLDHNDIISCESQWQTYIQSELITQKVANSIAANMTTSEIDSLAANVALGLMSTHPNYERIATYLAVSNLHKQINMLGSTFSARTKIMAEHGLLSNDYAEYVSIHANKIDGLFHFAKHDGSMSLSHLTMYLFDYKFSFFGLKTLERSYLLKINEGTTIIESPQDMYMRIVIALLMPDDKSLFFYQFNCGEILKSYRMLRDGYFTHATPAMFNLGTKCGQNASCFLITMNDDSIKGIYKTITDCAMISKNSGGLGVSITPIRGQGSYIHGTHGRSSGLVPMIRVFNETVRYVDQGGGKRKGVAALYLEPWHYDLMDFLPLRDKSRKDEISARDIFLALYIPDLFMERVEKNENWTLFSPSDCPDLIDLYGKDFEKRYVELENLIPANKKKVKRAQEIWNEMLIVQMETGQPYMVYKDACNRKSNQQNAGTIRSSNLCAEIIQYSSPKETAVCNLASIALPKFVFSRKNADNDENTMYFNFEELDRITRHVVRSVNLAINKTTYPTQEARESNKRAPMGIGIQGLADVFMMMDLPFESAEAQLLNKHIAEQIYFSAMSESINMCKPQHPDQTIVNHKQQPPYLGHFGSPLSKGLLQFDLWKIEREELKARGKIRDFQPNPNDATNKPGLIWETQWEFLRQDAMKYGAVNSLLIANMPTASTSQILGNNECFEPFTSNFYVRTTLSGDFVMINKHLLRKLTSLGLWSENMKQQIIANNGSVQNIDSIPSNVKEVYKTVWEMSKKVLVDMMIARNEYICQSQSFNVFDQSPDYKKLTSLHFYAWKRGAKTGLYYLRTKAATDAIKCTVDHNIVVAAENKNKQQQLMMNKNKKEEKEEELKRKIEEEIGCLNCGS